MWKERRVYIELWKVLGYITLKEGWLSVGSFKVVFEGGRRLDSEYEARTASGYLKFARGGTEQISKN